MPAKTHLVIARQWQLLMLLSATGKWKTVKELVEELAQEGIKTTVRTVERDLKDLEDPFGLVCYSDKPSYRWRRPENAPKPPSSLSLPDALSLTVVEDMLLPLLPKAYLKGLMKQFSWARKILKKDEENPLGRWVDKVRVVSPALHLLPPEIDPEVLETIHDTLLNDRQVEVTYHAPHREEPQSMTLHPLGLVQRGPVTYLVATAFDYEDVRLYAMHRIKAAKRIGRECRRPENFSLDNYLATGALDFGDGKHIRFEAMVSEPLATLLRETPLSKDMVIRQGKNGLRLTCSMIESWQLHWWILSLGDEIEVLAPKGLRKAIALRVRAAADLYK